MSRLGKIYTTLGSLLITIGDLLTGPEEEEQGGDEEEKDEGASNKPQGKTGLCYVCGKVHQNPFEFSGTRLPGEQRAAPRYEGVGVDNVRPIGWRAGYREQPQPPIEGVSIDEQGPFTWRTSAMPPTLEDLGRRVRPLINQTLPVFIRKTIHVGEKETFQLARKGHHRVTSLSFSTSSPTAPSTLIVEKLDVGTTQHVLEGIEEYQPRILDIENALLGGLRQRWGVIGDEPFELIVRNAGVVDVELVCAISLQDITPIRL